MSYLVDIDGNTGEVKRWPWIEQSLTPTPSNPFAIVDMRSANEHFASAGLSESFNRARKQAWETVESSYEALS